MANLIEANIIPGVAVYGVKQHDYTVNGVAGQGYGAALAAAAFKESTAIEHSLNGYAAVVRQRMRKLDDLGKAMAAINAGISTLKTKEIESSDKTDKMAILYEAGLLVNKYGLSFPFSSLNYENGAWNAQMRRDDIYRIQNQVQYEMDREDNDLKQDMVSLNSLMSKRDNAYSAAARLVKKANNAEQATIGNIGG